MRTLARAPERISPRQHGIVGSQRRRGLDVLLASVEIRMPRGACTSFSRLTSAGQLRDRRRVVGAVHRQHRIVAEPRARPTQRSAPRPRRAHRARRTAGRVAVAGRQVLGAHPRAVRRLPAEGVRDRRRRARRATRPHRPVRRAAGAAASARRGRTCRAGSRPASVRRSPRPAPSPCSRLRTSVSPLTRNSSMRICHGPMARRPDRTWPRRRSSCSGRISR